MMKSKVITKGCRLSLRVMMMVKTSFDFERLNTSSADGIVGMTLRAHRACSGLFRRPAASSDSACPSPSHHHTACCCRRLKTIAAEIAQRVTRDNPLPTSRRLPALERLAPRRHRKWPLTGAGGANCFVSRTGGPRGLASH